MDSCLGHILESTKGIEIKLGTYIYMFMRGSAEDKNHNPILHYTYLSLLLFIKGGFLCHVLVYKLCLITRSAFL